VGVTFDGSTDYYNLASPSVTTYPFTMACWFRASALAGETRLMAIGDSASTSHEHALYTFTSGTTTIRALSRASSNAIATLASPTLSTGTWYHGCAVFASATDRTIYLDYVNSQNDTTSKTPLGADVLRISREARSTSTKMWTGDICHPAVWADSLLPDEVAALAAGAHPTMIRPGSLTYYLPLETVSIFDPLGNVWTENGTPVESGDCPPVFYPSDPWVGFTAGGAPPAGLSIPVAMHHYTKNIGAA